MALVAITRGDSYVFEWVATDDEGTSKPINSVAWGLFRNGVEVDLEDPQVNVAGDTITITFSPAQTLALEEGRYTLHMRATDGTGAKKSDKKYIRITKSYLS
jgi:hypothetical protein